MKKQAMILLVLMAPVFFASCEKEETLTSAEFKAQQLIDYTQSNALYLATVYMSRNANGSEIFERTEYRSAFRIEAPFLIAEESGRHYLLDRLIYFEKQKGYDNNYELHLYLR
jgi:hypothetical protein